ncbi:hypothetical protein [Desertivirga brevis]|uniref:hypothetical protein n=1 Tax=Desertivirga brevis TaxID=2810310 RepID=UPI001A96DF9B|nr:hypothetical protein [Pedobacter sp. SYSU D00873]
MKTFKSLTTRIKSPTPPFFKKIRKIGILLGAIGTALLSAPISLPAAITTAAGYLVTAGLVATAVSSTAVEKEEVTEPQGDNLQ